MNFLLDTCIISEFTRHKPEPKVINWVASISEQTLFLSAVTLGEIQFGIERLPDSPRKNQLLGWVNNDLVTRFSDRILSLDNQTLSIWGSLKARLEKSGQPLPVMDSLIAATALQHNLILVTQNVVDFRARGLSILNPWE